MTNFKERQLLKSKTVSIFCFLIIFSVVLSLRLTAQNTVYTPLYNSGNFIKTIDFTKPVGEIAGSVSATASGGVTYSIPIYTCPGTNSLQPSISLTYNSHASAGIAGYGWNISGLSTISRTGKNIYHNGIVSPVNYTASDAFLLDGMRLNAISGSNGANQTIYAGEAESFAKIISYTSNTQDSPDWFQVTAKDGTIMEFGNSVDSRLASNAVPFLANVLWRLNKIIDINGNYIEFKYDNTSRDSRIQQILYTGNANIGLLPFNQVNFTYSIRADQNFIYESGANVTSLYLLDKIEIVHTNDASINEIVKTYRLNYGFDNVTSMLKELVEFGGDENSPSLNSTIFLYGEPTQNVGSIPTETVSGQFDFYSADFDADGRTDLLAAETHFDQSVGTFIHSEFSLMRDMDQWSYNLMYTKPLPTGTVVENVYNGQFHNFLTGDYNGDGRDDVLQLGIQHGYGVNANQNGMSNLIINYTGSHNSSTGYYDYVSTPPFPPPFAMTGGNHMIISHVGAHFFIPGDFDGDGNQDYILILGAVYNVQQDYSYKAFFTSPKKGIINNQIANFGFGANNYPERYAQTVTSADMVNVIDFDGDGKMEILVTKDLYSYVLRIDPTTVNNFSYTTNIIYTTSLIRKNCIYFPGDFNSDKKTDFLVRSNEGAWSIVVGTGTSLNWEPFYFNQTVGYSNGSISDKILIADFNGDGKSDIMHGYNHYSNQTSKLSMYYSKGVNGLTQTYNEFWYEQYDYNNRLGPVLILGDFNGDGRSDFINRENIFLGGAQFVTIRPFSKERLLKKITTGHNVTTSFDYKLLTDKSTYPYFHNRTVSLDGPSNMNPYNYVQLPIYAVSSITLPDGIGGNNLTEYFYEDAVAHRAAKGFLGFKKVTTKNNVIGITAVTENEINTQFAVPYVVRQTTSLTATNQQLSESLITNSFQNLSTGSSDIRYLQKIDKTLSIDYLNDNRASESVNSYDNYGNITNNTTKVGILSGITVTPTETTVSSSAFSIHNTPVPAKPDYVSVTSTRTGMPAISATTTYTYTTNGLNASETVFSGLPKAVTTAYTYDNFGNTLSTTTSATGLSNRTAISTYDAKGRFILSIQKTGTGLSQMELYTVSSKWGTTLTQTSTDCLTTTNEYDNFGRLTRTILPDGNEATVTNVWQTYDVYTIPNPYKLFYTQTHYLGGKPDTKNYVNKFGQNWLQQTVSIYGIDGAWHTMRTTYNNRGNVKTKTNLYFPFVLVPAIAGAGNSFSFTQPVETPRITTFNYDSYNRISSVVNDIGTANYTYSQVGNGKMQITITNPAGQNSSQIIDATEKVVSSIDNGGQLDFTYNSRGNQKTVNQSGTTLISSVYDEYGKQVSLTDINAGTTVYSYDAYGQLKQQTDALGNTYNLNYDDFGRIINRAGPEGTTAYEYYKDAATNCSNNSISKVTGFNGVIKQYTYDGLRRLLSQTETIDGIPYTTGYQYNSFSQLSKTSYPSGLAVYRSYDASGYLNKVYHSSTHPKNSIFQEGWVDGEGNYLTYGLGFGQTTNNTFYKGFPATTITSGIQSMAYSFDLQTGNLLQRTDNFKNQTENFGFDNLNRLTASTPNSTQQSGITYDANGSISMGNIVAKTDAGYYKYRNDKINAVAYIMNTPVPGQLPVTPTPNTQISLLEQQITYTPFLKTATVGEGNFTGGPYLEYTYGPDYQRVKSELWQGHLGLTETKYYLGDYEKQIKNGVTREIHYVSGGNGLCAILVKESGVLSAYMVYTDHLGSITTVTDNNGANIIAEQNFDAWGRNRNPNNWNVYDPYPNLPDWLYRGFTGHEMMPLFGMINMNGRMYDPTIGRMLSPDILIPAPYSTQGYNRYTYAFNNPLSFTDPDGNEPITLLGGVIIGAMIGAFTGAVTYDMAGKSALGGFWRGGLVGGVGGLLSGALSGTFASIGLVGSGIVQGTIVGTATGGLNAILDGSNIWRGASGGAISGAILGGVTGVIKRLSLKTSASTYTGSSPTGEQFSSQPELEAFINNNVGNLDLIENNYRTDFKLASSTVHPDGYFVNSEGLLIKISNLTAATGTTSPVANTGWFSPLHSTIHIAPAVKGLPIANGLNQAHKTVVHELIHAYHLMLVSSGMSTASIYKKYTESAASSYNLAYFKTYNAPQYLLTGTRKNITSLSYPSNYSWRNLLKSGLINMGIK